MFKRYTWPAKRAIFYGRSLTVLSESRKISSVDLLRGLVWGDDSRAQTIFRLREHFPLFHGFPWKFDTVPTPQKEPPLDGDCRLILGWTAAEATRMGDYWIDTEHVLLGILRVRSCWAARYLETTGLSLRAARQAIQENRSSRPNYGNVPRSWPMRRWMTLLMKWGWP